VDGAGSVTYYGLTEDEIAVVEGGRG